MPSPIATKVDTDKQTNMVVSKVQTKFQVKLEKAKLQNAKEATDASS